MAERTYTQKDVLRIIEQTVNNTTDRIFAFNEKANIVVEKVRKKQMETEITKRVKEALITEREAYKERLDRLTANTNDLKGLIGTTKATYDAMMIKLENMKERENSSAELYETFVNLVANVSGLTNSLDKIVRLLEKKSKPDRDVVA